MANKAREKECLHSLFRANEPKEPSRNIKKLVAFTLAEVLITLAIIGVVAALTIPTLVTSYQKKMYATQLKKSYNNLTNGFKTAMANEGVSKLTDTALWSNIPKGSSDTGYAYAEKINSDDYKVFFDEFKRIFKVSAAYGEGKLNEQYKTAYKFLNGDDFQETDFGIYLADGSSIYFSFQTEPYTAKCNGSSDCKSLSEFQKTNNTKTKLWENVGEIHIDVNGPKGPNIIGRDYFVFVLGNDGMLYPWGGVDVAVMEECNPNELDSCEYYWKNNDGDTACSLNSDGAGCAGRVMEENWTMNY